MEQLIDRRALERLVLGARQGQMAALAAPSGGEASHALPAGGLPGTLVGRHQFLGQVLHQRVPPGRDLVEANRDLGLHDRDRRRGLLDALEERGPRRREFAEVVVERFPQRAFSMASSAWRASSSLCAVTVPPYSVAST